MMRKPVAALFTFIMVFIHSPFVMADSAASKPDRASLEAIAASLKYQNGKVVLENKVATLQLPEHFRFLGPADSERVLTQIWGNPPGTKALGMIFPSDVSPASADSWGVVITYAEDGHVSDADADGTDYNELLVQMKKSLAAGNETRQKQGYPPVELLGWAENPSYDKAAHKLYWAKEIKFGNDPVNTLNYNVRILGRRGVLVLNAVAGMNQLSGIKKDMQQVIAFTEFETGSRYADFDPNVDKLAAYGIAALVAGGMAAKLGLFAKLGVILLAAKKIIILAVAGAASFIMRLFKRKKAPA